MAQHFVYTEPSTTLERQNLFQGDVLSRSPELLHVLEQWHPYYQRCHDYKYFLVLTQSCHLFRRTGAASSSPYITICAVRPVDDAIKREARKYQSADQQKLQIFPDDANNKLALFAESLLDNNQRGYFYLHEDESLSISGQNVAFLRLAVSIREAHYTKCLDSRIAMLKPEFRAKLGHLTGDLYSQVGTSEWNDHYEGNQSCASVASGLVRRTLVTASRKKIDKAIEEAKAEGSFAELSPTDFYARVKRVRIETKKNKFDNRIDQLADEFDVVSYVNPALRHLMGNDDFLNSTMSRIEEAGEDQNEEGNRQDAKRKVLKDCIMNRLEEITQTDVECQSINKPAGKKLKNMMKTDQVIKGLFN